MLLDHAGNVNQTDAMGMTALMHASRRGQIQTASLLLRAGAKINESDSYGRTALMYAALNGHADLVTFLLAAGADVDSKDKKGDTALILSARYSGEPSVARLLKAKGAMITMRDAQNRTPGEIAYSHGYREFANVLGSGLQPVAAVKPANLSTEAHQAVLRSLPLIENTTANFTAKVGCNSCHHQGVGMMTTGTAKFYGYVLNKFAIEKETKSILGDTESHIDGIRQTLPHPESYKHLPGADMEEFTPAIGVSFAGLAQHGVAPSEATDAMTTILARLQRPDGSWGYGFDRAPVQSSLFMTTAYAIRVLKTYLPGALSAERQERIANAKAWLIATPAKNNEDRAFRLLGLKWAGAPETEIAKAVAEIRAVQRPDGGWAQFSDAKSCPPGYGRSDAYATGESLYALYIGGSIASTDAVYRRGVAYLVRTQDDDGSWFINKRAIPVNNYLDTGFPHGVSQYISYTGTCWATMALIFAADPAQPHTVATVR